MNLREEILQKHSKEQCDKVVTWVGTSQKKFDELFSLFMSDEPQVVQRSAWAMSHCVEAHPAFIKKHFKELVAKLELPNQHDAVKRNSVRLLQHVDIPEEWQGSIMNICFDFITFPSEAVAIKAFSITVLGNMAKDYPEIIPELKLVIKEQIGTQTAAFKVRALKLFKELKTGKTS